MKKVLLASTAIAGLIALGTPAQAAQPITVTLGGLVKMEAGLWDTDEAVAASRSQMGYELRNESEIYVDTTAEADNGLKYGVHIEIEYAGPATGSAGDGRPLRTDEANIFLSGGFGTLEIGDQDGASDTLAVFAPTTGYGSGLLYGDYVYFAAGDIYNGSTAASTKGVRLGDYGLKVEDSSDATKITYYTPTFAGFRAGITYGAAAGMEGDQVVQQYTTGTGARRDWIEGGVQYKGEFSGVGVLLGAVVSNYSNSIANYGSGMEDYTGYQFGANFSYAGFTLGGSWLHQEDDVDHNGNRRADDSYEGFNVGLGYKTGPVAVGVAYMNLEDSAEFSYEAISVGATYTVAPGLAVFTDVTWYDNKETVNGVTRSFAGANTNGSGVTDEGTVFLLGTSVAF